jgi:hypothetical protein
MSLFHLEPCEVSLPTVCEAQVQKLWDTKTSLLCSAEPSHSVDSHLPHTACEEIALVEINTQCCKTELGERSVSSLLPHHITITRICAAVIRKYEPKQMERLTHSDIFSQLDHLKIHKILKANHDYNQDIYVQGC